MGLLLNLGLVGGFFYLGSHHTMICRGGGQRGLSSSLQGDRLGEGWRDQLEIVDIWHNVNLLILTSMSTWTRASTRASSNFTIALLYPMAWGVNFIELSATTTFSHSNSSKAVLLDLVKHCSGTLRPYKMWNRGLLLAFTGIHPRLLLTNRKLRLRLTYPVLNPVSKLVAKRSMASPSLKLRRDLWGIRIVVFPLHLFNHLFEALCRHLFTRSCPRLMMPSDHWCIRP